MHRPLIRKVDCVSLPVSDLDEALSFYQDRLGHELIWRTPSAMGLRLAESDAELGLHTEGRPPAAELLVDAVPAALSRFVEAGGSVLSGPFDIQIGKCAVVSDPWGNHLVLLDTSKGALRTDAHGNVVEQAV